MEWAGRRAGVRSARADSKRPGSASGAGEGRHPERGCRRPPAELARLEKKRREADRGPAVRRLDQATKNRQPNR